MQDIKNHILNELEKSSNGNRPETSLFKTYRPGASMPQFMAAISELEQEGIVVRVPPFHVWLK